MSIWPERDEELRGLIKEKLTARQIAERMGLTKNAVCGRAHRLGVPIVGQPKGPRPDSQRSTKVRVRALRVRNPRSPQIPSKKEKWDPYRHLTLMEMNDGRCHFIEGEVSNGYCGRPIDILQTYCPEHLRRMYQPHRH